MPPPSAPQNVRIASIATEAQQKLARIEEDFSRWASNFIAQRDIKKSELERSRLEERQKELEISRVYRNVFQYAVEVIRASITAYNSKAGTHFQLAIPDLPLNLYDVRDRPWIIGTLDFGGGAKWTVRIWSERPADVARLPFLELVIENPGFQNPGPDLVRISIEPPNYNVVTRGGGLLAAVNLNAHEALDSYEKTLPGYLQTLIETQIASLQTKN